MDPGRASGKMGPWGAGNSDPREDRDCSTWEVCLDHPLGGGVGAVVGSRFPSGCAQVSTEDVGSVFGLHLNHLPAA